MAFLLIIIGSQLANYYGKVDGQSHTLRIDDLSETGVRTEIRFGDTAGSCTQVTPPAFTEEGQYTVYYRITYTFQNVSMTENGVAYVWLREETAMEPAQGSQGGHSINIDVNSPVHQFVYLDTVAPTCSTLGYDRWLCPICGAIDLRNYWEAKSLAPVAAPTCFPGPFTVAVLVLASYPTSRP